MPDPPRPRDPGITPSLEALILRLLAKDPTGRPDSGLVVPATLREEICDSRWVLGQDLFPGQTQRGGRIGPIVIEPRRQVSADTPTMAAAAPVLAVGNSVSATTLSPEVLRATPELVREMLEAVLAEPITLSPDERNLCGHYLAYLLGGARLKGPLLRRKLDPKNADRARLLLGLTAVLVGNPAEWDRARRSHGRLSSWRCATRSVPCSTRWSS